MKVLLINNDGAGFADTIEVAECASVSPLFNDRLPGRKAGDYLIRVNRLPTTADQLLQPIASASLRRRSKVQPQSPDSLAPRIHRDRLRRRTAAGLFIVSENSMSEIRQLARAANRLSNVWLAILPSPSFDTSVVFASAEEQFQAVRQAAERIEKAHRLNLILSVPHLYANLGTEIQVFRNVIARLDHELIPDPVSRIEGVGFLSELRQIEAEFGPVTIDWKEKVVSVATDSIVLEGIDLGPFDIEFHWNRLAPRIGSACFDIVAIAPNPAGANPEVTHPHVRDRSLCAGDAMNPIKDALDQGRLADAFILIRSVLSHYNADSPFVRLSEWEGVGCGDCGRDVGPDERSYCDRCGLDYCDGCSNSCAVCYELRCDGCTQRCHECDERCCPGCLKRSATTGHNCCPECLKSLATSAASVAAEDVAPATSEHPDMASEGSTIPNTSVSSTISSSVRPTTHQEDFVDAPIPSRTPAASTTAPVCADGVAETSVSLPCG